MGHRVHEERVIFLRASLFKGYLAFGPGVSHDSDLALLSLQRNPWEPHTELEEPLPIKNGLHLHTQWKTLPSSLIAQKRRLGLFPALLHGTTP